MVTVDVILFAWLHGELCVLLIRRKRSPFRGYWAIPGGFVEEDEGLEHAAERELREETSVGNVYLEQLYTFGNPDRDPRGRCITVSYIALINSEQLTERANAGSDASDARWFPVTQLPRLAFDHSRILQYALDRLRNKLEYTTVGFQLLSRRFTLTELQRVYEAILGKKLDKRNFRKKILSLRILRALPEMRKEGRHRPAQLFTLVERRFQKLKDRGIIFPF